jgi:hypothetical protein
VESDGAHRRNVRQSRWLDACRPLAFREADALFRAAESQIALLGRARPVNGPAATARWLAGFARGERGPLDLRYAAAPALGGLRQALDAAGAALREEGPIGELYAERAAELELEARLAERVGDPAFAALARLRYAPGDDPEWTAAEQLARRWAQAAAAPPAGELFRSDDAREPRSLVSVLAREVGARRLPIAIRVVQTLESRAACGDGAIFVRAGVGLTRQETRRLAAHELLGHALPRVAGRTHPLGLLGVGSARANDDEEGRALYIEAQHGALDAWRQRELGLRHLAALAVAGGASAPECVELLGQFGSDPAEALALYARCARGGGLCRELVYIPAWLRFSATAEDDPALAAWLSQGRSSLAAARVLRAQGVDPRGAPSTFSTCQSQPVELPVALSDDGA